MSCSCCYLSRQGTTRIMEILLLLCIIALLAGLTQGISGFGSVLLSLPLLAIFIDIKTVIPLTALFAMVLTTILLIQLWKNVEWRSVYPLLIGAVFGIPVGVFLLKRLDRDCIQIILGVTLLLFSFYNLWHRIPRHIIPEKWAYLFGFLAGCLGGAITAAGPPVIVYTSLQSWSKDKIKATLQGFFFVTGLLVVLSHALGGITTPVVIKYFIVSLPFLVLGTYAGSFFYGLIEEVNYRKIILILLALLGVFMICKATLFSPAIMKP